MLTRNFFRRSGRQIAQCFIFRWLPRQLEGHFCLGGRYGYQRRHCSSQRYQMRSKVNILPRPTCNCSRAILGKQLIDSKTARYTFGNLSLICKHKQRQLFLYYGMACICKGTSHLTVIACSTI